MRHWAWLLVILVAMEGACVFGGQTQIPLPEGAVVRFGTGWPRAVAFSSDGDTLAIGTTLGVELRNAKTLELYRVLIGHTGPVNSVAFSPDGTTLASGSHDNTIKLWEVGSGDLLHTLSSHTKTDDSLRGVPGR